MVAYGRRDLIDTEFELSLMGKKTTGESLSAHVYNKW